MRSIGVGKETCDAWATKGVFQALNNGVRSAFECLPGDYAWNYGYIIEYFREVRDPEYSKHFAQSLSSFLGFIGGKMPASKLAELSVLDDMTAPSETKLPYTAQDEALRAKLAARYANSFSKE